MPTEATGGAEAQRAREDITAAVGLGAIVIAGAAQIGTAAGPFDGYSMVVGLLSVSLLVGTVRPLGWPRHMRPLVAGAWAYAVLLAGAYPVEGLLWRADTHSFGDHPWAFLVAWAGLAALGTTLAWARSPEGGSA